MGTEISKESQKMRQKSQDLSFSEGKVRVRLYCPNAQKIGKIVLSQEQTRHLAVLRVEAGEKIRVFDGKGREFEGFYEGKVRDETLVLEREVHPQKEPAINITLATAVPKGQRIDFLVEKVSELGVDTILPLITARSVVEPRETKLERLSNIAIEACCQSGRARIPAITPLTRFKDLLGKVSKYEEALICHKTGSPIGTTYNGSAKVIIIVGPEGDFTHEELELAEKAGCKKVSLGPTVLRVETAGIAAVAQLIGCTKPL